MDFNRERYDYDDLKDIIKILRSDDGCPWDRAQTHKSLKPHLVEEAYEVLDAIDKNNSEMLKDELGDYLLQVFLHSEISNEDNEFSIDDVIDHVCKKMIFRHSFVFGNDKANDPNDAIVNWEKNKRKENNDKNLCEILSEVSKVFPALIRAEKVYKRIKSYLDIDYSKINFFDELRTSIDALSKTEDADKERDILADILGMISFEAYKRKVNTEVLLHEKMDCIIKNAVSGQDKIQKSQDDLLNMHNKYVKDLYK